MKLLDIAEHIKCSECGKVRYGTGPYQCSNGHLICQQCHPVLSACPKCHIIVDAAIPIKCHVVVDIMMDKVHVPCYFKARGCSEKKMERGEMREHVAVCPFRNKKSGAVQTPEVVAGSSNDVDNESGGESSTPVIAYQDSNCQPAETEDPNHGSAEAEVDNHGAAEAEDDNHGAAEAEDDNHGAAEAEDENHGAGETTGVDDPDDEDQNSEVAITNNIIVKTEATEEIAKHVDDESQTAGFTDHDVAENQNAGDADHDGDQSQAIPVLDEYAHVKAQEENSYGPDVAYQAEEGNDVAADTMDEADGAIVHSLNSNDLREVGVDGTDEDKDCNGSVVGSQRRYASRKRQETERYTALPFGPVRKRVKTEGIAPPPLPARKAKSAFAVKAAQIQTRRPQTIQKKVRAGRKKTKCSTCGKVFPTARGLAIHDKRIHKSQKRFACKFCKLDFPQREHVAVHMAYFHCNQSARCRNSDGVFKEYHLCAFCIYIFEKHELPDHIASVHKDKF